MNKISIKIRQNKLLVTFALLFALIITGSFFLTTESFSSSDLDYFKGKWKVTLRNNSKISFDWTVKEDLDKSWLNGVVESGGQKISTDFWRQTGKKIERFAFTSNSTFVKIESEGWNGNKMILNGILNDGASESKIRETITKVSEKQFNALWEREDANGKWIIFGDEICTK